jgi:hypothetical protein
MTLEPFIITHGIPLIIEVGASEVAKLEDPCQVLPAGRTGRRRRAQAAANPLSLSFQVVDLVVVVVVVVGWNVP